MDSTIHNRLKKIRLVAMDIDGTLTDGAMYYSPEGDMLKRFDTRDGMGITLLHCSGIQTAFITSEDTDIVRMRAKKLKINHVFLGIKKKNEILVSLCEKLGLAFDEIAYIGDDINDIPAFQVAGITACPADACAQVKNRALIQCTRNGGHGAVRELAEIILTAQEKPLTLPEDW